MPLRILQVGIGGFGRSWASTVIPQIDAVELVGCVDVDPASLAQARALVSLPADRFFLSLDEALQTVECDAVLVTAVLIAHMPVAMAALAADKHVLVEKPFAPTLEEAQLAVDTAAGKDLVLMVSQNYRFFPAVRAVQRLVADGSLGSPDTVNIDFRKYDNAAPRRTRLHYVVPQPLLVDMAIHHFDLMRAVLNREPREIYCHSWNPPWSKYDDPPAAVATIRFDGDVVVSYRGSWVSAGPETPWGANWQMSFAEAEVGWSSRGGAEDLESDDWVHVRPLGGDPRALDLPEITHIDRAGSLAAFAQAVQTGEEPETSGRDNLRTLALTIAALESAEADAPVLL